MGLIQTLSRLCSLRPDFGRNAVSPCTLECHFQSETKIEPDLRLIFHFNDIDPNINKETLSEIKRLYTNYLKTFWSYKQVYKYFKRLNLTVNISSTCLVVTGTVAGGFTLNSVILRTISGVGLLLKTFSEIKDCKKKIEMCKFAHTTSEKVLVDLRTSIRIRSAEFNQTQLTQTFNQTLKTF